MRLSAAERASRPPEPGALHIVVGNDIVCDWRDSEPRVGRWTNVNHYAKTRDRYVEVCSTCNAYHKTMAS